MNKLEDGTKALIVLITIIIFFAVFISIQWLRTIFQSKREFIKRARQMDTLVDRFRLGMLYKYCSRTTGEIWECGVYKGGTANAFAGFGRTLRLFDTFEGMPEVSEYDNFHKKGDFKVNKIPNIKGAKIYKGFIPDTFKGLEECKIGFAHVDVDIYQSVLDCCKFIVPRLAKGGIIIFDDYGFRTCKGAKKAVDEFFGNKIKRLWTRQAIFINK